MTVSGDLYGVMIILAGSVFNARLAIRKYSYILGYHKRRLHVERVLFLITTCVPLDTHSSALTIPDSGSHRNIDAVKLEPRSIMPRWHL